MIMQDRQIRKSGGGGGGMMEGNASQMFYFEAERKRGEGGKGGRRESYTASRRGGSKSGLRGIHREGLGLRGEREERVGGEIDGGGGARGARDIIWRMTEGIGSIREVWKAGNLQQVAEYSNLNG